MIFKLFRKKINSYKDIFRYLSRYDKYLDISSLEVDTNDSNYKNKIWQFWMQGKDNLPPIVKTCTKSIEKYYPDDIIFLDKNNLSDYIELPDFILDKYQKGIISHAHFSDILRVFLLTHHGGLWIDSTVLLTGKIPDSIINSEVFFFKSIPWSLIPQGGVPTFKMLEIFSSMSNYLNPVHAGSSWFICAKPHNLLLELAKKILIEYWEKENYILNYFLLHYILTYLVLKNKKCNQLYSAMPNYNNRNPHLLGKALKTEFDPELYSEIQKYSNIHKLSYKIKLPKKHPYTFFEELSKEESNEAVNV